MDRLVGLGDGAATSAARAQGTLASLFPPEYRAIQRVIISVGRKQYVCDGLLQVTTDQGWHLALVSSLGSVTELRVNRQGATDILKVTPLFREAWARQFVARDLRWLFLPPPPLELTGQTQDGLLVFESPLADDGLRTRYLFGADGARLRAVERVREGRCLYRASVGGYRACSGGGAVVPTEFLVDAGQYQLHLRTVDLSVWAESTSAQGEVDP